MTTDGKVTRLTDDGYVYGDVGFSPDGKYLSYARSFGTDMIIEQKLNHGGPRDLFIRPVGRRRADQPDGELGSRAGRRAVVAGQPVHLLHRGDRRREASVPRRRCRRGNVEQVTKGPRRLNGITYRQGVHDDRLHGRRARGAGGGLRRRTSTAPASGG